MNIRNYKGKNISSFNPVLYTKFSDIVNFDFLFFEIKTPKKIKIKYIFLKHNLERIVSNMISKKILCEYININKEFVFWMINKILHGGALFK